MFKKAWDFFWHDDSFLSWLANVVVAFITIKYIFYPLLALILGTSLPVVAVISGSMEHSPNQGMICGVQADDFWSGCGSFYEERNITQEQFQEFIFPQGFNRGDVMMITSARNVEVGDVIVFQARKPYPIIHRVIDIFYEDGQRFFVTKGDHNQEVIREYALVDSRRMCSGGPCLFGCYQEQSGAIMPSLCGPGASRVTHETPNAIALLDEARISEDQVIGRAYGRIPLIGYVKILFIDLLEFVGLGRVAQVF